VLEEVRIFEEPEKKSALGDEELLELLEALDGRRRAALAGLEVADELLDVLLRPVARRGEPRALVRSPC
jgi:hypothetical protein